MSGSERGPVTLDITGPTDTKRTAKASRRKANSPTATTQVSLFTNTQKTKKCEKSDRITYSVTQSRVGIQAIQDANSSGVKIETILDGEFFTYNPQTGEII